MTTIGLVRHGSTDWNAAGRMQGKIDIPLNEEGRRQALLLGQRLAKEDWDYIYSSDMIRALETAEIIAEHMGKPVTGAVPGVAERSFGLAEGTTEAERIARWGLEWRKQNYGGEPKDDVLKRALYFLEELRQKHPGEKVLVISHGAVIGIIIDTLFPELAWQNLENTSVNIIEKNEDQWFCQLHNCTKHLEM